MVPEAAAVPHCNRCFHPGKLRVLIVTGRNIPAHGWRVDTPVPRTLLEGAGKRKPLLNGPIHSGQPVVRYDNIAMSEGAVGGNDFRNTARFVHQDAEARG
jgi:hypothetical protein